MNAIRFVLFLVIAGGWCLADDRTVLATEVHRIFKEKCADCHGSHLPKPKGRFGFVLDLGRVGKVADYVTPGDAEKSEIYQMVLHNEMPGEDADVPPLTPDELKTVAAWIKQLRKSSRQPAKPAPLLSTTYSCPRVPACSAAWYIRQCIHMPTTVHIPAALLKSVDRRAKALGLSRNRLIIRALEHAVSDRSGWAPEFLEKLRTVDWETKTAESRWDTAARSTAVKV